MCSVISGWEQVLSWYFKILEDRMIVKVQMFAEIGKNKLDFCLKCNQHPANFKLQKQLNLCQWTARYPPPALVFMELSSSTYKMDTSSEKGKSGTMMWHQSKPSFFFFFSIKYHHYHIKWAISCCQGNFSAEFGSCKHNFPKIISWLIRSIQNGLSLPFYINPF